MSDPKVSVERYRELLRDLRESEDLLGRIASLLSEVADAICETTPARPDSGLVAAISDAEWPTLEYVKVLVGTAKMQRAEVQAAWDALDADQRQSLEPPDEGDRWGALLPLV